MSIVVHGAGRDLTVAGPVYCRDCFETDHRGVLLSRREGGVEGEESGQFVVIMLRRTVSATWGSGLVSSIKISFWSIRRGWVGESVVRL